MSAGLTAEAKPLALVAPTRSRRRRTPGATGSQQAVARTRTVIAFACGLALLGSAPGFYALERHAALRAELAALRAETQGRLQQLDAGFRFDSRQRRRLLFLRDEILAVNPKLDAARAYEYATHLVAACDKYSSVDPLLLLAIGTVESHFDTSAVSHARARGLYQILPSTGRMLAGMLGWQFAEDLLHDPARNTMLAALYLHVLSSAYNDESLVLAEYNGGPLNAGYIRAGGARASAETRRYVATVSELRKRLARKFDEADAAAPRLARNEAAAIVTTQQAR